MDYLPLLQEISSQMIDQLGFGPDVKVSSHYDADQDLYQVLIQTDKPGLIIGYHGETLSALQLFLGQHLRTQTGSWVNLSVNVNDYRERRQSALDSLADSVVIKVVSTGLPHSLPPMPANERRLVHLHLANHPQVSTASEGLGRTRSVVISPKTV
jgi:spoIIIJ-associated protein